MSGVMVPSPLFVPTSGSSAEPSQLRLRNNHDGTVGVQRTLLADRTEEQPSETALPPGPNDEEGGVVPGVDQYLGRRTLVVVALDLYRRGQRSNLAGGPIDYLQHGLPNLIGGDELVAGFEIGRAHA